jgi:diguanylate cyclase (GGDEF)-like protein
MTTNRLNISLENLDLLVVEDDGTSALMISRALAMHGARVEIAVDGYDGLMKFQNNCYPIVITDINMPGLNGLELVSRIKESHPDTHVIATSANSETDCLIKAIGLGFSDYFLKPVDLEKLILAVKKCSDIISVKLQLENEREKFHSVVDSLGEGVAIKDLEYRILYQNRALTEMFGDFTGSACYEMFGNNTPCTGCPSALVLEDGQTHSVCKNVSSKDTFVHVEISTSLVKNSCGTATGTVAIIRDVSERIGYENTIRDLAFHDPLTGLANRRLFEDRLEQAIAKSHRYGRLFGLLYLDLDHFKEINDAFGHETGDQVLLETAERVKSCCKRDLDTICRQGGDEFCILFTDCGERSTLDELAHKLLRVFTPHHKINGSEMQVTASIGISVYPDDGADPKSLEDAADKAMYAAKRAGRNTYIFFDQLV